MLSGESEMEIIEKWNGNNNNNDDGDNDYFFYIPPAWQMRINTNTSKVKAFI